MSENKVKLSLTLSADNRAQMQALSIFASALALGETNEAPATTETPVALYGQIIGGKGTANEATVTTTEAAPVVNLAEEEKPKRKRRTAAEMKAEESAESAESEPAEAAENEPAEAESEDAVEEAPAPKNPPAPSKITLDDVRRAVAEKKEKHLQIMKFKLKEDFGVSKTPDLAPHQYEAFYNFLNNLD